MHHILIVDDQRDIRQMLRAGIETLDAGIQVTDVPSGEEALLVIPNKPVDVLISDVYLPGISGLELKKKAQAKNPNLKLILITGVVDPGVRQAVVNSEAEAFFFKPVDMADFLDAVRRCINLPGRLPSPQPSISFSEGEVRDLTQRLELLRQEWDAVGVSLLNQSGRALAQTTETSIYLNDINLRSHLLAAVEAGRWVSKRLGGNVLSGVMHFPGEKEDLFAVLLAASQVLVISTRSPLNPERAAQITTALSQLQPLITVATPAAVSTPTVVEQAAPVHLTAARIEPALEPPIIEDVDLELPDLTELFGDGSKPDLRPEDVDAFWDTLAESSDRAAGDGSISYEQACELGLAPGRKTGA